jgi:hypothetical protein
MYILILFFKKKDGTKTDVDPNTVHESRPNDVDLLPAVLYSGDTWYSVLREGHRLRVLKNKNTEGQIGLGDSVRTFIAPLVRGCG